jgi:P27 family predicted phage terminase small subunit
MKTSKADSAPSYLAAEGRAFFERITEEFELDAPALQTLALACKQLDRLAEARQVLQREPVVVPDRFGFPKTHPAVEVERNAAVAFARLMREIGLDLEPPSDVRPPRRPGA